MKLSVSEMIKIMELATKVIDNKIIIHDDLMFELFNKIRDELVKKESLNICKRCYCFHACYPEQLCFVCDQLVSKWSDK